MLEDLELKCTVNPDSDYMKINTFDDNLEVLVRQGGDLAVVHLSPEDSYTLVGFIENNIEKPKPFKPGDVVKDTLNDSVYLVVRVGIDGYVQVRRYDGGTQVVRPDYLVKVDV